MRDPKRIDGIIEELRKAWHLVPDWRLGQLICNLGRSAGWMDPFFIEDDKMLQELRKMLNEETKNEEDVI